MKELNKKAKNLDRKELHTELQVILSMPPRLTFLVQKELNQLIASNTNS